MSTRHVLFTFYLIISSFLPSILSHSSQSASTFHTSTSATSTSDVNEQHVCPLPNPQLPTLKGSKSANESVIVYPTCSVSSAPADPLPELLSFEEWKAIQLELASKEVNQGPDSDASTRRNGGVNNDIYGAVYNETSAGFGNHHPHTGTGKDGSSTGHERDAEFKLGEKPGARDENGTSLPAPSAVSRSHIPLIDRFNYASNECNARIQSTHKSAKSASSILSRKKDRYMLSPCQSSSNEKQFVIVELCEDIRIDTVQLANFEFFSGIFKDIRISVAHTYTSDGAGWTSFHPTKELLPFYRYIRIDFLSNYGSEYFCPVSLLRVYGLTQMEEWKSDVWKAEWEAQQLRKEAEEQKLKVEKESKPKDVEPRIRAKEARDVRQRALHQSRSDIPPVIFLEGRPLLPATKTEPTAIPNEDVKVIITANLTENSVPTDRTHGSDLENGITQPPAPIETSSSSHSGETGSNMDVVGGTSNEDDVAPVVVPAMDADLLKTPQSTEVDTSTTVGVERQKEGIFVTPLEIPVTPVPTASAPPSPAPSDSESTQDSTPSIPEVAQTVTRTVSTTVTLPAVTAAHPPPVASPVVTPSGESIYRMIINRLTQLETNHTLYARYFEEQGRRVNMRLERMEEDIGRLDGRLRSERQHITRLLERQRTDYEVEFGKLTAQVEQLADEVLMEKRLSVAQLTLMVAVLVFMALTRGSRGEPIRISRASASARARAVWRSGIRSSGDWVAGWTGARAFAKQGEENVDSLQDSHVGSKPFDLHPSDSHDLRDHSIERPYQRSRRSSSQHSRQIYNEYFQTPPRRSRVSIRSRTTSLQSRAQTPTRGPKVRNNNEEVFIGANTRQPYPVESPTKSPRPSVLNLKSGITYLKSRVTPGKSHWRSGRSISLSGLKGMSAPNLTETGIYGAKPPGTKKLAKTAHMHEVRRDTGPGQRRGSVNSGAVDLSSDLDASLGMLSPMIEDPNTPGYQGISSLPAKMQFPELNKLSEAAKTPAVDIPISRSVDRRISSQPSDMTGIPFPSPLPDRDNNGFTNEDDGMWVDEDEDEDDNTKHVFPSSNSYSPSSTFRGRRRFFSPKRSFAFSSSPPFSNKGKTTSDVKKNDDTVS
ncbi:hypothetical protein CPB86DRAFT_816247 [Serendipita vermifera]|nr:hypothetical protein CPB86DRAFT_816247 [Serendipita vermifera]